MHPDECMIVTAGTPAFISVSDNINNSSLLFEYGPHIRSKTRRREKRKEDEKTSTSSTCIRVHFDNMKTCTPDA